MTRPRVLPHNLEAEASVLGGIILRNELLAELDTLEIDDFYHGPHKVVFEAMRNLEAASHPIDVVLLEVEIEKRGKLEAIGGIAFLGELALKVPTADNVVAYAAIVQSKRRARDLILTASELVERGYEPDLDVDEYLGEAMAKVSRCDRGRPARVRRAPDMVKARIKEIEERCLARERGELVHNGVPSGIAALDAQVGGYPLGDLSLIACRPGMGKTAMAMSCVDAATEAGFGAVVFSSEGGWRMMADRMISRAGKVPVARLRSADIRDEDVAGISRAALKYHHRPHWLVDDEPNLSAGEIVRRVRKYRRELEGGDKKRKVVVVVDYLHILRRMRGLEEHEALDEMVTTLAQAAVDDDIAYLGLSQLNREVEKRPDKRPVKSDLRGSGALEERPRMIVSPYRGAYYYSEPKDGIDYDCSCVGAAMGKACVCAPSDEEFKRLVKVLILKNSNGATGQVNATWTPETTEMS